MPEFSDLPQNLRPEASSGESASITRHFVFLLLGNIYSQDDSRLELLQLFFLLDDPGISASYTTTRAKPSWCLRHQDSRDILSLPHELDKYSNVE